MRFVYFRWPRSLAAQLLCTYATALTVTTCSVAGVIWFGSNQDAGVFKQIQLQAAVDVVRKGLRFDAAGVPQRVVLPVDLSWVAHDFATDVKYRILDRSGGPVISSEQDKIALTLPGRPFDSTLSSFTLASGGEKLLVRTERILRGTQTFYLQIAVSERLAAFARLLAARKTVTDTLRFAAASVVLVSVAVFFTLRRVLKPLRETSTAAGRIDAHNISNRLSTRNLPTEFMPVVAAFNLTLDRLEKGYSIQRAFLAGAAHELKTPLALIRAQIELGGTSDPKALLQDIDRMARQVNQLLHLAEASETQNYVFEPVDVAEVAVDVSDYLRRLADRSAVFVEVDAHCTPQNAVLQADRGALFMLLKNLMENAIQHSPAGGVVAVTIDTEHLRVRDEGPGIAADELPNLFKRFWRGTRRRNEGAGLGLSICTEIAAAHKWTLTARSPGHGAEFTISFRVDTTTQNHSRVA
jgi:two-component system sensor histidine kinase QseC